MINFKTEMEDRGLELIDSNPEGEIYEQWGRAYLVSKTHDTRFWTVHMYISGDFKKVAMIGADSPLEAILGYVRMTDDR